MKKPSGAAAARLVVVALIAVFLGIAAFTMLEPKPAGPAGRGPGPGGPPNAAGTPSAAGAPSPSAGAPSPSGLSRGSDTGTRSAANAITVSAKKLKNETIRQIVKLNGDVASQSEVNVQPETSGRVTRILKKLGDKVSQGDVIAYIDPSRAGVSYAENPVRAAASGTITALDITVGNMVTTTTTIAALGSLDDLKITIYVAEKYSAYLKRGLPAYVTFTATPGEALEAAVTSVSPVVNSKNRTIETTLNLITKDPRIKAGMFASVSLVIREEDNTLVVPQTAVKDFSGGDVVYVVTDNLARRVPVKLGLSNDTDVQITEGLAAGDEVITAGSVTDGSPVKVAAAAGRKE